MGEVSLLLIIPVMTAVLCWQIKNHPIGEKLQVAGALLNVFIGLSIARNAFFVAPVTGWHHLIYIDALSAFNVMLIVLIGFIASLYSVGYMRHEVAERIISEEKVRHYYLWFHLFIGTMLVVSVVNNIGLLWVGIELTTLVSALLVAFYRKGTSLEAAWKYLIMGSVGIAFALLGIIFLYLSGVDLFGESAESLNWTVLHRAAGQLNPQWTLIAFIFVLVGFGTKAGLAPMHFWLPDAHSQAPSPISAVLSGVLLNTALYGIFRIYTIVNTTLDGKAASYLIFFGLLSIAITVPFMLVQHDLKRMLAYSSVEHIGIITLGVGIGGALGLYGAVLHMFHHSMAKSLLFFAAGNITQKYHSKRMERISGVLKTMPMTGSIFLIAAFAITGTPPFNIFISEFTIMRAGFQSGHLVATVLFLLFVVLIFSGMMYYVVRMAFGEAPAKVEKKEMSRWSTVALFLPLIAVIVFGLYVPPFFQEIIQQVAFVLQGGKS
ncbi:hydrogenase 4 subunit F [Anoxybacillus sp. J5B_2022]|uniref:hydrogenase 4 subunit F n=1 Tax=Anoxybacillus sp. J5B_2022 TaxID=3003246 RepID=UPI0022869198|nr:hydrogenase 4 subunit F [Anoxybacillus sp. J5B_2022]MCZ0754997.1 hydrogenase 4 subunit F [Anoxybacillus sp. J5B_2022]